MYEAPTVLSLQNNEPMLAGCCCSIFMGLIVCVTLVGRLFFLYHLFFPTNNVAVYENLWQGCC